MTDGYPGRAELLRTNAALTAQLAALQAIVAEKEQIEADLRTCQAREDHVRQVLSAIRTINQLIADENDPLRLIQGACDTLAETRGYPAAWIALLDSTTGRATASAFSGDSTPLAGLKERLASGDLPLCVRQAVERDEVVAIDQPGSYCSDCFVTAMHPQDGRLIARLATGEHVHGVLAVVLPGELVSDPEERQLFQEVAGDLAFALTKLDTEAHHVALEQEQTDLLQNMVDAFAVYGSVFDEQGRLVSYRFEYINAAFEQVAGVRLEDVRGKAVRRSGPTRIPAGLRIMRRWPPPASQAASRCTNKPPIAYSIAPSTVPGIRPIASAWSIPM